MITDEARRAVGNVDRALSQLNDALKATTECGLRIEIDEITQSVVGLPVPYKRFYRKRTVKETEVKPL